MKPRITLVTLGVDDLERSVAFYRDGLGLETEGIIGAEFEGGIVAFFELERGVGLALYPRKQIARDAHVAEGPRSPTEFTLGHNVGSPEEVDEVLAQAGEAGATVDPAQEREWGGYSGHFQALTAISGRSPGIRIGSPDANAVNAVTSRQRPPVLHSRRR